MPDASLGDTLTQDEITTWNNNHDDEDSRYKQWHLCNENNCSYRTYSSIDSYAYYRKGNNGRSAAQSRSYQLCINKRGFDVCTTKTSCYNNAVSVDTLEDGKCQCHCKTGYSGANCNECDVGYQEDKSGDSVKCTPNNKKKGTVCKVDSDCKIDGITDVGKKCRGGVCCNVESMYKERTEQSCSSNKIVSRTKCEAHPQWTGIYGTAGDSSTWIPANAPSGCVIYNNHVYWNEDNNNNDCGSAGGVNCLCDYDCQQCVPGGGQCEACGECPATGELDDFGNRIPPNEDDQNEYDAACKTVQGNPLQKGYFYASKYQEIDGKANFCYKTKACAESIECKECTLNSGKKCDKICADGFVMDGTNCVIPVVLTADPNALRIGDRTNVNTDGVSSAQ